MQFFSVKPMGIVLLDIGNVIVDVDFHRFCRSASREGERGAEWIFRRYCQSEEKLDFDRGLIAPRTYLAMMAGDPSVRPMSGGELRFLWQDIFSPKKGTVEAVEQLREKHHLWIMSDTDPLHFAFLLNSFPVLKRAERYLLSYEHGWLKRDPEAFLMVPAISRGMVASDFMMIDDREENCRCAESCGIRAHLFNGWKPALDAVREW
jgi:glucose-1-phosphatase